MKAILPTRDGVSASACWLPDGTWPSLLAFLTDRFPAISRETWLMRLRSGRVLDAEGQPLDEHAPYCGNRHVYYYRELPAEPRIPFEAELLYRDEHLLVVDKPHFLPVIPSGRFVRETLLVRLKETLGLPDLAPVHRIDKDTAGLVLFACQPASRGAYQQLFQQRSVQKTYLAVAPLREDLALPLTYRSRLDTAAEFFRTAEIAGEANAESHIELLDRRDGLGLYRLSPVSGRKHQLRVHMAALGIPICNDVLYPVIRESAFNDFSRPLQLLAQSLAFSDPLTGQRRTFTSQRSLQW